MVFGRTGRVPLSAIHGARYALVVPQFIYSLLGQSRQLLACNSFLGCIHGLGLWEYRLLTLEIYQSWSGFKAALFLLT